MGEEWMFQQVRTAAGIHMSTFKEKAADSLGDDDEAGDGIVGGSDWTPPPSFMATLRKS